MNNPPINLLDPSPNDCDFSLDLDLSLSSSCSLHSNNYDLEECLQDYMHVMTPSIPYTIPLNNPKTIQIPSSIVDSSFVGLCSDLYLTWFEVFPIFEWLVIHDLSHIWTNIKHVWIYSKYLWFKTQLHPSFIFLHSPVFPNCSRFLV